VDGALADVGAAGDLPLAEFLFVVQSKNFVDLTHGLPLSGQRGRPLLGAPS
jgi:hypothetical protein